MIFKKIFIEPKDKKSCNGAILFAVTRGKVFEGLDFSGDYGRGVIITGLPYESREDPKIILKQQFLNERKKNCIDGLSGEEWYQFVG